MSHISVIDLGTGSIRNTIYNKDGSIAEVRQKENPVIHPKPGWAEQDPVKWWYMLQETFMELPAGIRQQIAAISVTSQREGMVPVDQDFQPLSNMIIWLDGRTLPQAEYIEEKLGAAEIYDITGLVPNPAWSLAKILWIKEHQPDVYAKTYKLLQAEDYFISRLSRIAASEFSIASRTCLLDVKKRKWSEKILATFDIDGNKLPALFESGSLLGTIHPQIASQFDLSAEVQIIAGAGDQQAAAVGVGAFHQGVVSIGIGTSSALSITLNKPVADPTQKIILNCAAIPGHWEFEPPIWNTGGLVKWFADNIDQQQSSYQLLLEQTEQIAAGADGLWAMPFFSGAGSPRWNPALKGGFYGLTLAHQKPHLLKAILESIAFEIKHNLELVEEQGISLQKIVLSGGASRNQPLCQIIADVLQVPVEVFAEAEASSKGAFLLVKSQLEQKPLTECFAEVNTTLLPFKPNNALAGVYQQHYQKYQQLADLLSQF